MSDLQARLQRYGAQVPRYTSYPPATRFTINVDAADHARWLSGLRGAGPVSVYLHVPFCHQLCLYCGCNTAVVRSDAVKRRYASMLAREIEAAAMLTGPLTIAGLHWGGGTPTAMPAAEMLDLHALLLSVFSGHDTPPVAAEIDPRHLTEDHLRAFARMGLTRASLGVQDLNPAVQQAIGRVQDYALVRECAARLRGIGVGSLNMDLIYGLPGQTAATVTGTARKIVGLRPERIAVFGYAHVPWVKKHQALLCDSSLPDLQARFTQAGAIADVLSAAGYIRIGLDHYALPGDDLAQAAASGRLRRNFQGYTSELAVAVLGFGASAISALPQGFAQNAASVRDYEERIGTVGFATVRGVALDDDDRRRGAIIHDLMCYGEAEADLAELAQADAALRPMIADGLVQLTAGGLRVTEDGWPFLRSIAAAFDRYRAGSEGRHALAV